jgi:hypothetical protein
VVWGEVIEYEYDIPEVEATDVEELDLDELEAFEKRDDGTDETPPGGGETPKDEEAKRKGGKLRTYATAATAFLGTGAAALANQELIDEDDVVAVAAIVNTGVLTSQLAVAAGNSGTAAASSGTTATAASGGGGVATGNSFASAVGVGSSSAP